MTVNKRSDREAVNKIFGTEIPQESSDERDPGNAADERDRDGWLRDNVPPHHN
jgi:hypothetical protein